MALPEILTLTLHAGNRNNGSLMVGVAASDIAVAGQRLRRKVRTALGLSAVVPLLVLSYVAYAYVMPQLSPADSTRFFALLTLLFFTGMAIATGAWVIWDIGRSMARVATMLADEGRLAHLEQRRDEVGTLMSTVGKMLETIEQQASEINSFAGRLDAAYKELENTNTKLKETSFKDEVTGLYNRRFFSIRLEEEMQRHRRFNHPVSVVLMDLDGFKAVNDELGHTVGDETLRDIAQILVKHSRGINVVARWGGDEFAVLLVETSRGGARLYADRIRQVVSSFPFSHGKRLTASFGIASLPDDDVSTSEDLLRTADEALYAAKRSGKNQVATTDSPEKVG
jgi:diguanylate cyclase (GGDEF)-like protein